MSTGAAATTRVKAVAIQRRTHGVQKRACGIAYLSTAVFCMISTVLVHVLPVTWSGLCMGVRHVTMANPSGPAVLATAGVVSA